MGCGGLVCFFNFQALDGAEIGTCAASDAFVGYLVKGRLDLSCETSAGEALCVPFADFCADTDTQAAENTVFGLFELDSRTIDTVFGGEFLDLFGIGASGQEKLEYDLSCFLDPFGVCLDLQAVGDLVDA